MISLEIERLLLKMDKVLKQMPADSEAKVQYEMAASALLTAKEHMIEGRRLLLEEIQAKRESEK